MDRGLGRGESGDARVGQRHLAVGEGTQHRSDVRLADPEDPRPGTFHADHVVEQWHEFGADPAGAVVKGVTESVAKYTAAADPAVVVPAFLAAASAGEVAQATGAVGAPALSVWADPGQQTVCPAVVTDAVGLARFGEAAGADPAFGPIPEGDPDTAAWVLAGVSSWWPAAADGGSGRSTVPVMQSLHHRVDGRSRLGGDPGASGS